MSAVEERSASLWLNKWNVFPSHTCVCMFVLTHTCIKTRKTLTSVSAKLKYPSQVHFLKYKRVQKTFILV